MEKKKPTRDQLERRIKNAILHIDKTKETSSFYFSDRGIRLTVNDEYAVIETGFHRHVFDQWTNAGASRPYIYTRMLIDTANAESEFIKTENGYSFAKLLAHLKDSDESKYNVITFVDWWLFNIFQPLYSISESTESSFLVYEDYVHNIARNAVLLEEHGEDVTNKKFIDDVIANIKSFTDGLTEYVILHKMTDEEYVKANIDAANITDAEQTMEEQAHD